MHILCILHTITTCYICNHNLIDISYICLYLSQVVYSNTYTYKHILYVYIKLYLSCQRLSFVGIIQFFPHHLDLGGAIFAKDDGKASCN